jgi:hypothetical protein
VTIDLAALPDDVASLHRMIGELAAALDSETARARTEIERLRQIIGTLQRGRFGRRSERLHEVDTSLARHRPWNYTVRRFINHCSLTGELSEEPSEVRASARFLFFDAAPPGRGRAIHLVTTGVSATWKSHRNRGPA